jgi:hypothetical protein
LAKHQGQQKGEHDDHLDLEVEQCGAGVEQREQRENDGAPARQLQRTTGEMRSPQKLEERPAEDQREVVGPLDRILIERTLLNGASARR